MVGSGKGISFKIMVESILDVVGKGTISYSRWPDSYINVETGDYITDISKISNLIKWKPKINLQTGIIRTHNFYKKYKKYYFD